jgi:hypothetical protein
MSERLIGLVVLIGVLGLAQASLAAWDPNTDPSLVGWWKLDETSGTTAGDSSMNKNTGNVLGAAVWGAGRTDGCLQFDGSNDYVDLPIGKIIQTMSSATVAGWANWSQQGGAWQRIFDFGTGETVNMFLTPSNGTTNGMRFAITTGGSGAESQLTASNRLATGWHHIAVVINGDTRAMQLYLDDVVVASGPTAVLPKDLGNTTQNWLGRSQYPDAYYNGSLDDFRIYSRALSAQEIRALVPPVLKATSPTPANGEIGVPAGAMLQWTPGETAVYSDIYVGMTPDLKATDRAKQVPSTVKSLYKTLQSGQTYYWRVDSLDKQKKLIVAGDVWSFTTAPVVAFSPVPADGAQYQDPNIDLSWSPGQDTMSQEVYFSTNKDDVVNGAEAAFQGVQAQNTLELPTLALETTYYWRVDEIDSMDEKHLGDVWSFTTTVPGLGKAKREIWLNAGTGTVVSDLLGDSRYPGSPSEVNEVPNFESLPTSPNIDNYGGKLSAWLHVPLAGQYTFWVASDDDSQLWLGADPDSAEMIASADGWTNAQEWDKFASQKSKPITLEAGRYYLMALWKDGTGGDNCAAAWQGAGIPNRELIHASYLMPFEALWAYGPRPRNNDPNAAQILELKWTAGTRATAHQIYFSEDQDAVANGTQGSAAYRGQQPVDNTTFDPGTLEFGKTYYWRVDEISTTDSASPWKGSVWKFTTANYIVVDNFEDYTDDVTGRIFQTWIDGWGYTEPAPGDPGNGTGATVGYINPPFAEKTIVRGGVQSMPLAYNNADSPYYSETSRTFDNPQNWTVNGMNTLSLQVRGYPQMTSTAVTETGGKMTLTGSGTDIWNASDDFTFAYKTLNGDATLVAKVTSMSAGTQTWAKGGVMIRDSLDGNSMQVSMDMTGSAGNGASFQYRSPTALTGGSTDSTGVVAPPYWVKLERVGDTFNGYTSSDGNTWTIVATQDVVMTAPVYVGLCVTAHSTTGEQRTVQFEGIKTTGNVTGAWQGALINSPQFNSPQNLYVAVQDSAGKLAVVTDATTVNSATWTEVQIPLTSFNGVSVTKVKKIFIGVGDRNSPAADGTGMLFIDDIRVIKP